MLLLCVTKFTMLGLLLKFANKGITVFKFVIWGGISSDIRSEILFYSIAVKHDFRTYIRRYTYPNDKLEYGYPHSNVLFKICTSKQGRPQKH